MFKISTQPRTHRTLHSCDADFHFITNGITLVPRAGFEISQRCPREYRLVLAECIDRGWLQPVANIRDTEYTMEMLQK